MVANFTLYLQPLPQEADRIAFTVDRVAAVRGDGTGVPLPLMEKDLSGDAASSVQRRLSGLRLPSGHYRGISLHIASAAVRGENGAIDLSPPTEPLFLSTPSSFRSSRRRLCSCRSQPIA